MLLCVFMVQAGGPTVAIPLDSPPCGLPAVAGTIGRTTQVLSLTSDDRIHLSGTGEDRIVSLKTLAAVVLAEPTLRTKGIYVRADADVPYAALMAVASILNANAIPFGIVNENLD